MARSQGGQAVDLLTHVRHARTQVDAYALKIGPHTASMLLRIRTSSNSETLSSTTISTEEPIRSRQDATVRSVPALVSTTGTKSAARCIGNAPVFFLVQPVNVLYEIPLAAQNALIVMPHVFRSAMSVARSSIVHRAIVSSTATAYYGVTERLDGVMVSLTPHHGNQAACARMACGVHG